MVYEEDHMPHIPVLLKEVLALTDPKPGEYFVDATIGNGGHAEAILEKIIPGGKILGIDWNNDAIMKLQQKFHREIEKGELILQRGNFAMIAEVIGKTKFEKLNCVIADLGMSSEEIEESGRGFSFLRNEPLLMTYEANPEPEALTAGEIINTFPAEDLVQIFRQFGEERRARRYASAIIAARKSTPIRTSAELATIIEKASFGRRGRIHPATKIFQALRIAVNTELENLTALIENGFAELASGGKMLIISYYSLEDRIVKQAFRARAGEGMAQLLTKKPITPSFEEIKQNPRSRSAKLRVIRKI